MESIVKLILAEALILYDEFLGNTVIYSNNPNQ